jgi:ZIP family zinc transporter/zinc and cadmium transporter
MLGAIMVLVFYEWSEKNSFLIINFASGVMLTLAFTHLMPKGLELTKNNPQTITYVLFGFLIMFFLQFILLFHPCHDTECSEHNGVTSIIGLSLHSVIDGLIIAASFKANIGILTTLAILLHKLPDGITISGVLMHKGISRNKIFGFSFFAAGLTVVGTILGIFLLKNISNFVQGNLLAITSGSFIFLSASDLIPETHKCKNRFAPFMLFVGTIFIFITEYIFTGYD